MRKAYGIKEKALAGNASIPGGDALPASASTINPELYPPKTTALHTSHFTGNRQIGNRERHATITTLFGLGIMKAEASSHQVF
jgi:hypothetical protein